MISSLILANEDSCKNCIKLGIFSFTQFILDVILSHEIKFLHKIAKYKWNGLKESSWYKLVGIFIFDNILLFFVCK